MIRYHGKSPQETSKLAFPEVVMFIEEGTEELKGELRRHADLKCAIMNASHFQKKDEKPYEWKDFLPKELLPEQAPIKELSHEEKAALWSAAGNAFVNQCRQKVPTMENKRVRLHSKGKKR